MTNRPAKLDALDKVQAAHEAFRAKAFLKAAMLLDDAADILKAARQWKNNEACATIVAVRARMAELAGDLA